MTLREQLMRDEGLRLNPYRDQVGKFTIGYGHNLDDKPISSRAAETILDDDLADAAGDVLREFPWAAALDEVRFGALVNLAFNMGIGGLLGFTRMLAALERGDHDGASRELLDSKYARQVGLRAQRLARQLVTGAWQ